VTRRASAFAALAAACLLATAPPAGADQQTASSGATAATFTFERVEEDGATRYAGLRLTVSRGGAPLYDQPVVVDGCDESSCILGDPGGDAVRVRDVDGDAEPEVLLDLYTGGAHCCVVTTLLRFDGAGYTALTRNWGDHGYRLGDIDGDGRQEFVSSDARFAYAFASFASSIFPEQIWALRNGQLTDVTRERPDRIRRDARRAWRLYRRTLARGDYEPRGPIAAWAADRYLLGERAGTLRLLRRLARRGRLPGYPPRDQRAFVRRLDRFLVRLGYAG
jgi:hypothetical protein